MVAKYPCFISRLPALGWGHSVNQYRPLIPLPLGGGDHCATGGAQGGGGGGGYLSHRAPLANYLPYPLQRPASTNRSQVC